MCFVDSQTLKKNISKTEMQSINMGMSISQNGQTALFQDFRPCETENTVEPVFNKLIKWRNCYNYPPLSFNVASRHGLV